jgi:hypothetical protein
MNASTDPLWAGNATAAAHDDGPRCGGYAGACAELTLDAVWGAGAAAGAEQVRGPAAPSLRSWVAQGFIFIKGQRETCSLPIAGR